VYVENNNKRELSQNCSYEPLLTLSPSHPLFDKGKERKTHTEINKIENE
jgi:hypothetical protein